MKNKDYYVRGKNMNTSYEKLSFYNNYFGGYIDGDNILSTDFYGNKSIVGVTTKKHKETVDLLNTYYNKLVELGVIEKEKTPEDIAKEQQQMMQAMFAQMQVMQEKLDSLQQVKEETKVEKDMNNGYEPNSENDKQTDEFESKSARQFIKFNRESKRNS